MISPSDVSVVVPVYGPPDYFLDALESVTAQGVAEIVVVDDGSPRPMPSKLASMSNSILLRHESNRGPGAARNTGLRATSRPWVSFIDADDLWVQGRLQLQLDLAQRHQAQLVAGRTVFMGAEGGPDPLGRPPRHTPILSTMLMRREIALAVPQDETSNFAEDLDFYIRAKEQGVRIHMHDDPVILYRQHPDSLTAGRGGQEIKGDLFRVLTRSLARRRAQAMDGSQ